jgi:hypothetical protein
MPSEKTLTVVCRASSDCIVRIGSIPEFRKSKLPASAVLPQSDLESIQKTGLASPRIIGCLASVVVRDDLITSITVLPTMPVLP